ncbi:hypothetical protein QHH03_30760, partial [Aphanizomenon sp. 202]|nr:hypothetical protein [Aphanizomenon sp. 202]
PSLLIKLFVGTNLLRWGLALTEAILEAPAYNLEVAETAGAGRLPADGLDGPIVAPKLLLGVAALRTLLLLNVVRRLPTSTAQSVRLIVPLSEGRCTLRHVVSA